MFEVVKWLQIKRHERQDRARKVQLGSGRSLLVIRRHIRDHHSDGSVEYVHIFMGMPLARVVPHPSNNMPTPVTVPAHHGPPDVSFSIAVAEASLTRVQKYGIGGCCADCLKRDSQGRTG